MRNSYCKDKGSERCHKSIIVKKDLAMPEVTTDNTDDKVKICIIVSIPRHIQFIDQHKSDEKSL